MAQRISKKGFIAGLIFGIILLLALGIALWYFLQPKASAPPQETTETSETNKTPEPEVEVADLYIGWKTYRSERDGYELKYPAEWIVIPESANDGPYIRNMQFTGGGYPEGYINLRVLRDEGIVSGSDLSPEVWYARLGVETVKKGPVTFTLDTVEPFTLNGLESKRAKSVFTEIDEDIFFLHKGALYEINMYPYGISENPEVDKILKSFTFI